MMKATEARAMYEAKVAEQEKEIRERAVKFCESCESEIKKYAKQYAMTSMTIGQIPMAIRKEVENIFAENGFVVYSLGDGYLQIGW